jgi:hypothetical protein
LGEQLSCRDLVGRPEDRTHRRRVSGAGLERIESGRLAL